NLRPGPHAAKAPDPQHPLHNCQEHYATAAVTQNDKNQPVRVGGVKYTIKDGIVYDAKKLAADVAGIVERAKRKPATSAPQQSPGRDC
ncbi:MAG: hypothetical protein ACKOEC_21280, partial [Acidimicrobiia bacterium]